MFFKKSYRQASWFQFLHNYYITDIMLRRLAVGRVGFFNFMVSKNPDDEKANSRAGSGQGEEKNINSCISPEAGTLKIKDLR